MASNSKVTLGKKQPKLSVNIDRLHPDALNPRLPDGYQKSKEPELLAVLFRDFNLDELAESMSNNGYFDEEPLVVIPQKLKPGLAGKEVDSPAFMSFLEDESTHYTVVEGNRRLATAKILLSPEARKKVSARWPMLTADVRADISELPVIVYRTRDEVVPYLGVRHIIGIQRWDAYAKARYIAELVQSGLLIETIESQIGDKQSSVRKSLVCFKALIQAEDEFEIDTKEAKNKFSLFLLAVGQGNIKRYLGLPSRWRDTDISRPIPKSHLRNLRKFLSWVFGEGSSVAVISESRDITRYLTHVVSNETALDHLETTGNLEEAYDRSDGEEAMVLKYLSQAGTKLDSALGLIHRHRTPEVILRVERCFGTVRQLRKAAKADDDS